MGKRYRRLRGDTAYYPFAARTGLRARQRRRARRLRWAGAAALVLAGALFLRQTVFNGGQPKPPALISNTSAAVATGESSHVTVEAIAATRDALAHTEEADAQAHRTPETAATPPPEQTNQVLPQYRALYEENSDLIGWLRMDGTDIDLPVVQTPGDNEYYLRRGFDGLYATGGTLFLDEQCSVLPEDSTANWLIYGHNMADGSMFGELTRYREESFYKEHPTFTFDTIYESGTWQVVAALDTTLGRDDLPYYTFFDADSPSEWQERVDAILSLALYDTGITPEYGQQLLTLSTCGDTRLNTKSRFALLAVRVEN
ncbi:MAG: class B sortase [Gemmiger sp.]|uniref:class B sortase n=1 Tax=Gemmiger sp. TaxID=2049027 RepID=UPI002E77E4EC|nr:class B sortase [Gemmiger sp.]MEE0708822.1 class B sortase [Gemmiger sp.]